MNIDLKLEQGLRNIMESPSVKRVDFCVGYFNLRGWKLIIDQVDNLPGDYVEEGNNDVFCTCHLLIGMHHHNEDYIRRLYGQDDTLPDANMVKKSKLQIAIDFANNYRSGYPQNRTSGHCVAYQRNLKRERSL